MGITDEINKKTGVSFEFSVNLFPRRSLKQYSGRSPDSKAFPGSPSHFTIRNSGLTSGLLYYSCGDSSGFLPDSLLMPNTWQPKYYYKKNFTNLTKIIPINNFHFTNCFTAFSCVSVLSNRNSSFTGS